MKKKHLVFRYAENAERLSDSFKFRESIPLATAVWWTEYIAKFKSDSFLKSGLQNLPWYLYYNVQLVVVSLAIALYVCYRKFHKDANESSKPETKIKESTEEEETKKNK